MIFCSDLKKIGLEINNIKNYFVEITNRKDLLLETGCTENFIKNKETELFLYKNKDFDEASCISIAKEKTKQTFKNEIVEFKEKIRIKKNGTLEVGLRIIYKANDERYINGSIFSLKEKLPNELKKIDKNKYLLKIMYKDIIFSFNETIKKSNVFFTKLNRQKNLYNQIEYLNFLNNENIITII